MKKITVVCLALCSFLFGGDLFSVKAQILEKFTLPTPWTEEALKADSRNIRVHRWHVRNG